MRARVGVLVTVGLVLAGCRTIPQLPASFSGCYDVVAEAPLRPFMEKPVPSLPPFVQIRASEGNWVLVPSQWLIERSPGIRGTWISVMRPEFWLEGPDVTRPRMAGVLPADSLVLYVDDHPGAAIALLARVGDGWRGRVVAPGPPIMLALRPRACPAVPMTISGQR